MKFVELFDKFKKKCKQQTDFSLHFFMFDPQNCTFHPRIKILRSAFGARSPEKESFYVVKIACQVTERERNQICRRRGQKS